MKLNKLGASTIACLAAAGLVLGACSNAEKDAATPSSVTVTSDGETSTKAAEEAKITLSDAYVKATEDGKDMTAIFGTIHNDSDQDVNVTGFKANIDAQKFELHEVVDGVMRQKEGGYVIPAGESLVLEPGKEHMMVMGLKQPIKAGDKVNLTIELADGTSVEVSDVPVRTIGAGQENYGNDKGDQQSTEMDHMEHMDHGDEADHADHH
ncbi:copper chaperone PCu(A)C [Corynebacterium gerontici]|uniref:Copper chaperone PCu(A)C n=1 Tax=Corynebacterium gerontici TaxID=2079234 RepID=A0A3G6J0K0_9CORY|nr:copper chaperone PCu(A)C [Corynebacterium gerontici]AZA11561.1 hypothetical protein CGERO_06270 [Corynebacterium gerontici]